MSIKWKILRTGLSGLIQNEPSMWVDAYGVIHSVWTVSGELRYAKFMGVDWEISNLLVSNLKENELFKSCIAVDGDRYPLIIYKNGADIYVTKWNGSYWEDNYGGPVSQDAELSSDSSSNSEKFGLGATVIGQDQLRAFVCKNGILKCYRFSINKWENEGSIELPYHNNTNYDISAFEVGEDIYLFWKMATDSEEWVGHCIYDTSEMSFYGQQGLAINASKGDGYLSDLSFDIAKLAPFSSNMFFKNEEDIEFISSSSQSSFIESPEPFIYENLSSPFLYEEIGGGNARITGYSATVPLNFVIPDTINGFVVTKIGENAFNGACQAMTSLTIPNSVNTIEGSAFYECYNLTSLTIGTGVLIVGEKAFGDCVSLSNLSIPNSVTDIGNLAFVNCNALTNLTLGSSLVSIGEGAFGYCQNLPSLTIPSSVESIGIEAFYGCSLLSEVIFNGDAPIVGSDIFDTLPVTIRFYDLHGFTTPTWSGYPSECIDC